MTWLVGISEVFGLKLLVPIVSGASTPYSRRSLLTFALDGIGHKEGVLARGDPNFLAHASIAR